MLMHGNADVLEVIAEYACGAVTDVCALRAANKGYRRAVDTTVRRLVYEDQPELRSSRDGSAAATLPELRVQFHSEHLDAVRIAFTCDSFNRIARLVVVAFALDGAKDALHEGEECGERPVACSDSWGQPDVDVSQSCWATPIQLAAAAAPAARKSAHPPSHVAALVRCLSDVFVARAALANDAQLSETLVAGAWPGVRRLAHSGRERQPPTPDESRRLVRVLSSSIRAAQLQCLWLHGVTEDLCSAIARCTCLTHFRMRQRPTRALSKLLCDALIESAAPLQRVSADCYPPDGLRLLQAVPSITKATMPRLDVEDLPNDVTQRLTFFNYCESAACFPRAERVTVDTVSDWQHPSEYATRLNVTDNARLCVADVGAVFPRLERITFGSIAGDVVRTEDIRLPPTLRELQLSAADDADLVRQITGAVLGRAQLPNLTTLFLGSKVGDITALAAFAATLTTIAFDIDRSLAGDMRASCVIAIEGTLAKLVRLANAQVAGLPSAKCFTAGAHRRLKELVVDFDLNLPSLPFTQLVRACPRLLLVQGSGSSFKAPGWSVAKDNDEEFVVARRLSVQ